MEKLAFAGNAVAKTLPKNNAVFGFRMFVMKPRRNAAKFDKWSSDELALAPCDLHSFDPR